VERIFVAAELSEEGQVRVADRLRERRAIADRECFERLFVVGRAQRGSRPGAKEEASMTIARCFGGRFMVPAAVALLAGAIGTSATAAAERLTVSSTAFSDGGTIPGAYANRGCAASAENRSPQLSWRGAPAGTKSFAVTMFDPDAPTGHGFWHWVLFNIPAGVHAIDAGASTDSGPLHGAVVGHADFGSSAYGGPCPPPGDKPHHYVITVRALDIASVPGATSVTSGPQLVAAVEGHVLAQGKLVGRFGR
jgi:Raf kinase inhibitor-like YbhB/YbcL family protein